MTANLLTNLTLVDLKNAVALRGRIDALRAELDQLLTVAPSSRPSMCASRTRNFPENRVIRAHPPLRSPLGVACPALAGLDRHPACDCVLSSRLQNVPQDVG